MEGLVSTRKFNHFAYGELITHLMQPRYVVARTFLFFVRSNDINFLVKVRKIIKGFDSIVNASDKAGW